ncbi:MAG: hypothetical protein KDD39_03180 [Bdellovibrionales bacterium]|nr:hypothetical protein [Bdellovibrionales bacterium]
MAKKIKTLAEIRSVLDRTHLPDLWDRAQKAFEKQSGWNRKQIQSTLEQFSKLNGVNKAFFGGLLLGQALLPSDPAPSAKAPKAAPKPRKKTSAARGTRAQ